MRWAARGRGASVTRSFKETVQARVQRDAAFREALLRESEDAMLYGDRRHRQGDPARLHQRDRSQITLHTPYQASPPGE